MPSANKIPAVFVVHPHRSEREELSAVIARGGFTVRAFPSVDAFLDGRGNGEPGCLIIDLQTPAAYELLERLRDVDTVIPAIMIAEGGDVAAAVRVMRAGASTLIGRPFPNSRLMREIRRLVA